MSTDAERQPLLPETGHPDDICKDVRDNVTVIDFHADDPENPLQWSATFKWAIVGLLAFMAFTVTFTCISVVPIANRIVRDLSHDDRPNKSASVLLVTIWELGEAAGPLFIGPLSEMFGRRRVLNVATMLFVAFTVLAASCQSTNLFIAARLLTGAAVASNVLNPAIVGDIFPPEQRGSAMSMIMIAPMIGGAAGPAMAGAIANSIGWRQVLWIAAVLALACEIAFLCCFRETYKVTILRRRVLKIQHENRLSSIKTAYDNDQNFERGFWASIARPFRVFYSSVVLQGLSLFGGMTFTYYYVMATTLPDVLEGVYGLSPALTGSCFICFSIGSTAAVLVCNRVLDRIYVRLRDANKGIDRPEYRLPLAILGAFTLPVTIAAYGLVAEKHLPLPVLLVAIGFIGVSLMLGFLPILSYVVDALGSYSASGMTAIIVARCLMGTFFPLAATPLTTKLGYGWGFAVLGAVSLALAPIPILIYKFGHTWRARSAYTSSS
ncbi:hypothetical protein LTS08_001986 [Lithohypha guttulata]|nr:hypothetical protein LTS08_001986 [Lithohypha guttulata]